MACLSLTQSELSTDHSIRTDALQRLMKSKGGGSKKQSVLHFGSELLIQRYSSSFPIENNFQYQRNKKVKCKCQDL